ncbi:unnamed protein product [Brassica oleracea]
MAPFIQTRVNLEGSAPWKTRTPSKALLFIFKCFESTL